MVLYVVYDLVIGILASAIYDAIKNDQHINH